MLENVVQPTGSRARRSDDEKGRYHPLFDPASDSTAGPQEHGVRKPLLAQRLAGGDNFRSNQRCRQRPQDRIWRFIEAAAPLLRKPRPARHPEQMDPYRRLRRDRGDRHLCRQLSAPPDR